VHKQFLLGGDLPYLVLQLDFLIENLVIVDFYALADVEQLANVKIQILVVAAGFSDLTFLSPTVPERAIAVHNQSHGYPPFALARELAVEGHWLVLNQLCDGLVVQKVYGLVEVGKALVGCFFRA